MEGSDRGLLLGTVSADVWGGSEGDQEPGKEAGIWAEL